ncbi:MAG: thioredoxin family protein [Cyclobacteriaceae bacterium]|nr:thioredoxin family protein [Cyclobacteriaceae bacterium]
MEQDLNVLLYFSNSSCSVCEPLYDKLELLIGDHFPNLQIKKINVVENPELRTKYSVFSSPIIILLLDGKEYLRSGGNVSIAEIKQKIQRLYKLKFDK